MSDEKYQNKYRIPSARATWHDYNGGAYFITVCTKNRKHHFGEICRDVACHVLMETLANNIGVAHDNSNRDVARHVSTTADELKMQLTKIGHFLHENLQNVTVHYPYAEIPLFVVMPNHWHAIIFIDGDKIPAKICRDVACHVSMETLPNNKDGAHDNKDVAHDNRDVAHDNRDVARHVSTNQKMHNIRNQKGFLSVVIGGIKSTITKYANENNIEFAWQTRFHDCIIRDQNMMNTVADYVKNNVARWDRDCFNENNATANMNTKTGYC